jgi:transposase
MSTDAWPLPDMDSLPDDPALLKQLLKQVVEQMYRERQRHEQLEQRMDLLLRRLYGRTSEKIDPRQGTLFDTNTAQVEEPAAVPQPETVAPSRKRKGHGRRPAPENCECREIVYDLTDAEKQALSSGGELIWIGDEISEHYEWEPSTIYLLRTIQKKYARRPQWVESGSTLAEKNVIVARKPPLPIPGGKAGPGLLAHVIVSKAADHLPLARQERIHGRHGVSFPRQTTCDWWLKCAELFTPLSELMKEEVLSSRVVGTDDTPVKIRDAHRKRQSTGYLWPYWGDERHRLVVFDYTPGHSRDGPANFLKHYRGYLQADAAGLYDHLYGPEIIEVACWAHARRKYHEVRRLEPVRAQIALTYIGQLYAVERELRERCAGEWLQLELDERASRVAAERAQRSRPVLAQFRQWLDAEWPGLLPKNPLREAMEYTLRQWDALCRYTDDGWLSIDNNAVERAIRSIAVGRKNWLFCGSDRGGQAAAVHFGLMASCARNKLDPFIYLCALLARLATLGPGALRDELLPLLPDRWQPQ